MFKFRIWDKTKKCYNKTSHLFINQYGNIFDSWSIVGAYKYTDNFTLKAENAINDVYDIEFSTTWKDKNGQEIHAGDVIKSQGQHTYYHLIHFVPEEGGWLAQNLYDKWCGVGSKFGSVFTKEWVDGFKKEIIGNVHELDKFDIPEEDLKRIMYVLNWKKE